MPGHPANPSVFGFGMARGEGMGWSPGYVHSGNRFAREEIQICLALSKR